MEQLLDFKVTDLMGVAGATIGLVIANAILLSSVIAKYVPLIDRYRALGEERRRGGQSPQRKFSLREQMRLCAVRIRCLRRGYSILCVTLLAFLIAVSCASLGVMFPKALTVKLICIAALFLGFFLMGCATALQLIENAVSKREVASEREDLSDIEHEGLP